MSDEILREMADSLRALGHGVEERVATRVGPELLASVQSTLAAGADPEGRPWALKVDGTRAYKNAASRVGFSVDGNLVTIRLTGPEVFGHIGARGRPVRQMLPDAGAGIPRSVATAIEVATAAVIAEALK